MELAPHPNGGGHTVLRHPDETRSLGLRRTVMRAVPTRSPFLSLVCARVASTARARISAGAFSSSHVEVSALSSGAVLRGSTRPLAFSSVQAHGRQRQRVQKPHRAETHEWLRSSVELSRSCGRRFLESGARPTSLALNRFTLHLLRAVSALLCLSMRSRDEGRRS